MLNNLLTIPESIKQDVDLSEKFQEVLDGNTSLNNASFEFFGIKSIRLSGIIKSDKSAKNVMLLNLAFESDSIFHDDINLKTSSLKKLVATIAEAVKVPCILFMEYESKLKICIPKSASEKLLITDWIYSDYQSKYVRESLILINNILQSAENGDEDYYLYAIRQELDLISSNDFHAGIELKKGTDSKQILDQIFENHPEYLEKIINCCRITKVISYKNVYPRVEAEEFWRHAAEDEVILNFLNKQGITDIAMINKWILDEKESRIKESQKNFYKTSMSDLDMREYMNLLLNNPSNLKK